MRAEIARRIGVEPRPHRTSSVTGQGWSKGEDLSGYKAVLVAEPTTRDEAVKLRKMLEDLARVVNGLDEGKVNWTPRMIFHVQGVLNEVPQLDALRGTQEN